MIRRILKISGLFIAVIILCIAVIIVWLLSMNRSYEEEKEYAPISELSSDYVTDVDVIKGVTQCEDLPEFEARKLWYYKIDGNHSEPHIECYFKRVMTEDEFKKFFKITENIYWDSDKDWTLSFSRGWSKKGFMDVPSGMKEDMAVKIEKLSPVGFTLSYWKNVNSRPVDADSLNKIIGMTLPTFSVVSYRSDIENVYAKLRFDSMVDKNAVDVFRNNSDEIKIDTFVNKKRFFFCMYKDEQYADLEIYSSKSCRCGNGLMQK